MGPITWDRLFREYLNLQPEGEQPAPPLPPYPGSPIRQGDTGENVRTIQQAINRLAPCHPGRLWQLVTDGIFGPMTRDAIFSFQSVFGIPITGVVDAAVWDMLMREAANCAGGGGTTPPPPPPSIPPYPGSPIRQGDTGENVRLIQQAINRLVPSYPGRLWRIAEDGIFGPMTRDAIFTFQSIFGMPITGVVDAAVWDMLMREAAAQDIRTFGLGETVIPYKMFYQRPAWQKGRPL